MFKRFKHVLQYFFSFQYFHLIFSSYNFRLHPRGVQVRRTIFFSDVRVQNYTPIILFNESHADGVGVGATFNFEQYRFVYFIGQKSNWRQSLWLAIVITSCFANIVYGHAIQVWWGYDFRASIIRVRKVRRKLIYFLLRIIFNLLSLQGWNGCLKESGRAREQKVSKWCN